jgi:hypothetical protein
LVIDVSILVVDVENEIVDPVPYFRGQLEEGEAYSLEAVGGIFFVHLAEGGVESARTLSQRS